MSLERGTRKRAVAGSRRARRRRAHGVRALGGLFLMYLVVMAVAAGLIFSGARSRRDAVSAMASQEGGARDSTADSSAGGTSLGETVSRALSRIAEIVRPRGRERGGLPDRSGQTRDEKRSYSLGARVIRAAMGAMGGIDPEDPRTIIRAELPVIVPPPTSSDRASALPDRAATERSQSAAPSEPLDHAVGPDVDLAGELERTRETVEPWANDREEMASGQTAAVGSGDGPASPKAPAFASTAVVAPAPASAPAHASASKPASKPASTPKSTPATARELAASAPAPVAASATSASSAAARKPSVKAMPGSSQLAARKVSDTLLVRGTAPKVAVFHTHSSEAYKTSWGADYCWGKPEGVIRVGEAMAAELSKVYGIATVHSSQVHDYPDWTQSYANALATMKSLLKEYPSIDAMIDIHRDSLPASKESLRTAVVDGQKAARVMIVVTDDSPGLPHPNWRKNYSFALKLNAQLDKMYPGLSRGVSINSQSRFNQHVHERAIIIEIGGSSNTVEEACRTARLIAGALAKVI
ncbi:MAG: stage II sporulation protein P [Clostridia bacterium]|nr:stage II sporulation protein P [Clostridia bacterium]